MAADRFQIRVEGDNESDSPLGWSGVTINVPTIDSHWRGCCRPRLLSASPTRRWTGDRDRADRIYGLRFGRKQGRCERPAAKTGCHRAGPPFFNSREPVPRRTLGGVGWRGSRSSSSSRRRAMSPASAAVPPWWCSSSTAISAISLPSRPICGSTRRSHFQDNIKPPSQFDIVL